MRIFTTERFHARPLRKCSMCGEIKTKDKFRGESVYCKPCHRKYENTPEQREKNRLRCKEYQNNHRKELNEKERERRKNGIYKDRLYCRSKLNVAIQFKKIIKPSICEKCLQPGTIQAHHDSYKRIDWNKIRWLCRDCHRIHHKGI